jgi:uncharacterized protein (DUF4415 family)
MKGELMKKATSSHKLTAARKAELDVLAAMPDTEIDTSEMPEQTDWRGARRGVFFRPVKRQLTLRLDADVIEWFRRRTPNGEGYETSSNSAPWEYVDQHSRQVRHCVQIR